MRQHDIEPRHLEDEEVEAALSFCGTTPVGAAISSVVFEQGLFFFSGYMIHKICKKHKNLNIKLADCEVCSSILTSPDANCHQYVTYRQYAQHVEKEWGLKYCTKTFAKIIRKYEDVFLYMFSNYRHESGFVKLVIKVITDNCAHHKFCDETISQFLIKTFVRVRTFQSVKSVNVGIPKEKALNKKLKKMNITIDRVVKRFGK